MKKKFSPLPAESGKKIFSPLKLQILQIFTAKFNAYLKFAGNIIVVSERWRSRVRSWWHACDTWFEPVYGSFFFVRNPVNAVKKIFHRKIQRNSYKKSPLSAHSTLKDAGALRWKQFFSPLFTANRTLFFDKTSTRDCRQLFIYGGNYNYI